MLESYQSLRDKLNLHKELPYTPDLSAAADFIEIIVNHCLEGKPATIFECSSGLTTLMLARCCQLNNQGHVISLEDGEEYAINTGKFIDAYALSEFALIIHAPLVPTNVNGTDYLWYSLDEVPDNTIDMLVIDGPSGFIQKHSRYPALPLLYEKLSNNCMVFLDDAARDDEKEIVELWKAAFNTIKHEYINTERGCSILSLNK